MLWHSQAADTPSYPGTGASVQHSNSGHQLLLPPAEWCPMFASLDHAGNDLWLIRCEGQHLSAVPQLPLSCLSIVLSLRFTLPFLDIPLHECEGHCLSAVLPLPPFPRTQPFLDLPPPFSLPFLDIPLHLRYGSEGWSSFPASNAFGPETVVDTQPAGANNISSPQLHRRKRDPQSAMIRAIYAVFFLTL